VIIEQKPFLRQHDMCRHSGHSTPAHAIKVNDPLVKELTQIMLDR